MNNLTKPVSVSIGGFLGDRFAAGNVITGSMLLGILTLLLYYRSGQLRKFLDA